MTVGTPAAPRSLLVFSPPLSPDLPGPLSPLSAPFPGLPAVPGSMNSSSSTDRPGLRPLFGRWGLMSQGPSPRHRAPSPATPCSWSPGPRREEGARLGLENDFRVPTGLGGAAFGDRKGRERPSPGEEWVGRVLHPCLRAGCGAFKAQSLDATVSGPPRALTPDARRDPQR